MKHVWFTLLLLIAVLVVMDVGLSALRWLNVNNCQDRGLPFDYRRQACGDDEDSSVLQWWSGHQADVRSLRTFALASFFTFSVVLIRRNRAAT